MQKINPEPPSKLFEKYEKSVVLVKNQFYAQLNLSNGLVAYFSNSDQKKSADFIFDLNEAKRNPLVSYGTGFFISRDGKIATNRHVAYPELNDANILVILKAKFDEMKKYAEDYIKRYNDTLEVLRLYYNLNANEISYTESQNIIEKLNKISEEKNLMEIFLKVLDFDPNQSNMEIVPVSVGIAYNNTFVENNSDFKECRILKKSDNEKIDLAIIQLKDRTTPDNVLSILDFNDHNPNIQNGTMDSYSIDSPLGVDKKIFMIGYNYGLEMANTSNGLKAQFTQGNVSQESDDNKVLYSIPALSGSSGSPIIDEWGNLVAINYAGVTSSQSFNYGILAKHLKRLIGGEIDYKVKNSDQKSNNNNHVKPRITCKSTELSDGNFRQIIKDFVSAEDRRDFEEIYSFYSRNVRRYWDLYYPSQEDIRIRYRHSWKIIQTSSNEIESIHRIGDKTYDLHTIFKYTTRKKEYKEVNSTVRFIFDRDGKIVECFGL